MEVAGSETEKGDGEGEGENDKGDVGPEGTKHVDEDQNTPHNVVYGYSLGKGRSRSTLGGIAGSTVRCCYSNHRIVRDASRNPETAECGENNGGKRISKDLIAKTGR